MALSSLVDRYQVKPESRLSRGDWLTAGVGFGRRLPFISRASPVVQVESG